MYFPDGAVLSSSGETTVLLLLVWLELFDKDSPDTFQPKLRDIPSLVEELHEVANLAAKSDAWDKHLLEIKAELDWHLNENKSLLKSFPKYLWCLQNLLHTKDKYTLAHSAKLLAAEAPDFIAFYADNLKRALQGMPREKGTLILAVNNLASFATRAGLGRGNLWAIVNDRMFTLPAADAASALCTGCSLPSEEYHFAIPVEGYTPHLQSVLRHSLDLRLLRLDEQPTRGEADAFFHAHLGARCVTGTVISTGPVAAAKLAMRKVRPLADISNFFNNRVFLSLKRDVLVFNDSGLCVRVSLVEQSLQRLRPRNDARRLSRDVLTAPLRERLEGRLFNAMELYSLAMASTATRVRLVNLWSAVECLLGTLPEGSIIDRSVSLIAPLMAWKRVEKIVRYLAICLHKFRDRYELTLPYTAGFENSARDTVQAEDLLHVLTKPDGHAHPRALADFASRHVLLRYRLTHAWNTLSKPSELRRELMGSEKRVRWQLFRIYRARNITVHHGDDAPLVSPMLDTLQYYLSVVLTRIVRELAAHPEWQVDDAVTSLLRETTYVSEMLSKPRSPLTTADFIGEPVCRVDELLWPSVENNG